MSVDQVLGIIYWALWAVLLIVFLYLNCKMLIIKKDSRDIYSIFTFLFMILMLLVRTSALYPLTIKDENINEYGTRWEEYVYNGIPLSWFVLAILTHTFRWFMLEAKLASSNSNPHKYTTVFDVV